MSHTPYTNNGDTTVYVGGMAILPGETREVATEALPRRPQPKAEQTEAPSEDAVIGEVVAHKAKDLIGMLGKFARDELERVEAAEKKGQARKGVLEAIANEKLQRASAGQDDGDTDMDEYVELLQAMSDDELAGELESATDENLRGAIEAEVARRERTDAE